MKLSFENAGVVSITAIKEFHFGALLFDTGVKAHRSGEVTFLENKSSEKITTDAERGCAYYSLPQRIDPQHPFLLTADQLQGIRCPPQEARVNDLQAAHQTAWTHATQQLKTFKGQLL